MCSRVLELDLPVVETTVASVEVLLLKCSRKLNEVLAAGVLLEEIIEILWVSSYCACTWIRFGKTNASSLLLCSAVLMAIVFYHIYAFLLPFIHNLLPFRRKYTVRILA